MNVILCGAPMSGKTYYGTLISEALQRAFFDTDHLIAQKYGTPNRSTCREIILQLGIDEFRNYENQVVAGLKTTQKSVISIGGGTLFNPQNVQTLKQHGRLIHLQTDLATLLHRLSARPHPYTYLDLNDIEGSFRKAVEQRTALCTLHADLTINTNQLSDQEIITLLKEYVHG